ncbi:MAG: UDP-N-acetylmuramate--L-alanine ligase [Bacilli bacterium]|nr:UDP-N-acetylmuramate--L-alanine ligase [Bacilli bacterium]
MKYYCIGIKGTGMSTLAQILSDLGNEVCGYDDAKDYKFTQKGLEDRSIRIYYDQDHAIDPNTIVTYSVAFSKDHPEIKRAKKLGLTIKKYNEIIGEIIDQFDSIGVSGTHGKTTTSSLIRHILETTIGCNYFIGAGDGYVDKNNQYFVIESDEFNRHFLAYHPNYAVITNIEEEHLECYHDICDIRTTFESFANGVKDLIVACGDNEEIRKIRFKKKVVFYGFQDHNDVVIDQLELTQEGSIFDLIINQQVYGHFYIPLYGSHMVLDAVAAIVICRELGISMEKIASALYTFQNAKRRFAEERIGKTIIIDDYAHHPTEIKATLEAVKQKYPSQRLIAVFKPNTYSRTKDFTFDFIESLSIADKVFLTEIDSNRERQEDYPGITSSLITDKVEGSEIIGEETIDKLVPYKEGVICFMSCASISHLIDAFKKNL